MIVEKRSQHESRGREASIDEDGLTRRQLTEPARRGERPQRDRFGAGVPAVVTDGPGMLGSLFLAEQAAYVLQGDGISDPRADELGAVVVDNRRPAAAIA